MPSTRRSVVIVIVSQGMLRRKGGREEETQEVVVSPRDEEECETPRVLLMSMGNRRVQGAQGNTGIVDAKTRVPAPSKT